MAGSENKIPVWLIVILLIALAIGLSSIGNEEQSMAVHSEESELKQHFDNQSSTSETQQVPLPSHEIVDEETQDTPVKTQVEQHILVTDRIEPANLRALLNNQYRQINSRSGFQYRNQVTNVYIYVYDSKERADRKGFAWIASLQKGPDESPRIQIKEDQIEINKEEPQRKFGLSEPKRKEIYKGIVAAEDRAREQAIDQEPDDWERQIDIEDRLRERYKEQLIQEYGISRSVADSIGIEGVTKQWPKPEL